MKQFTVISSDVLNTFCKAVGDLLAQGWFLHGEMIVLPAQIDPTTGTVTPVRFFQALTK